MNIAIENSGEPPLKILYNHHNRHFLEDLREKGLPFQMICRVYFQKSNFEIKIKKDHVSFSKVMNTDGSTKWVEAMDYELKS